MRLFFSRHETESPEPEGVVNLLWQYEVSEDDGKSWYPESERKDADAYVLRRGAWVTPPVN
jgi:hypothetical protein